MNYQTPKIVPISGRRITFRLLALMLTMLVFATLGYLYSQYSLKSAEQELASVIDAKEGHIQELRQRMTATGEQMAVLERSSQIDREAVEQIKLQLASYQEERAKQEEELIFLRSLVASKDDREGIQVRRFAISGGRGEGVFNYRFTISQTMANGNEVNGWVFLGLDGIRNGEPTLLPLREITHDKTERLRMRFKNFQDIQGTIMVPGDFNPLKFIVEIKPGDNKISGVKQRFDWKVGS